MSYKIFDATVAADAVSVPISVSEDWVWSMHCEWEAGFTATLIIQESNKDAVDGPRSDAVASTDWVNSSVTFPSNPAAGASRTFQNFHQSGARFIRLFVDHTAGAGGNLKVWFHSKRVS